MSYTSLNFELAKINTKRHGRLCILSWASMFKINVAVSQCVLSFTCMIHAVTGSPRYRSPYTYTTSFTLRWYKPYYTSCQQILGYRVQCRNQGGHTVPSTPATTTSYSRSYTVSNLYPYTYYNCCVTAYNNVSGAEQKICQNKQTLGGQCSHH